MQKILIIRLSSIGDIVLTTPVVRCLKKQLPGCEIHYLVKEQFKPVIESNPYIDKIHVLTTEGLKVLIPELKNISFDFIADLHKNIRSTLIKKKLKTRSASFNKLNFRKWQVVNLKINKLPDIHIVDRYFEAVAPLGIKNDEKGLDYFLPSPEPDALAKLPPEFQNNYILLVTGARHFTKSIPVEKIVSFGKKINKPLVLAGGPEDVKKGEEIAAILGTKIYNACGKFSLNESAVLVKYAHKVITSDTGLMHIAAAFKKDILSMWGNTIPEFGMYPYLPGSGSVILENRNLKCRPCSKLGYEKCPKKHFKCMMELDEEKIIEFSV